MNLFLLSLLSLLACQLVSPNKSILLFLLLFYSIIYKKTRSDNHVIFSFSADYYTEECIWCLLTGGVFAKTFDPTTSLNSITCLKPIANNTAFNLNNFTISSLENCNKQSISMTQPLTSNQVYCDSDFYALLKAVNQTLTEDRNAYTRDFIGKNLL